jgi:hypothetical protein
MRPGRWVGSLTGVNAPRAETTQTGHCVRPHVLELCGEFLLGS